MPINFLLFMLFLKNMQHKKWKRGIRKLKQKSKLKR